MSLALCLMFVLAAGLLPGRAAEAADLGDDCCADLEKRIAEFDAATVRRFGKVSVTLTGYVTKQVMSWDDGIERDAYIADIGPTQASNFRVSGQATIAPGWTAGYMLRVQNLSDSTMGLSQTVGNQDLGLNVQMSNWFVASEDYGKLTMGRQALASKSVAMFTDLSGTQLIANYVLSTAPAFSCGRTAPCFPCGGAISAIAIRRRGPGAATAMASS